MRVELFGLVMETPRVVVHLWSPWRAAAIEHRLFEAISKLPGVPQQAGPDEIQLKIEDERTWRQAVVTMSRVLKGWQEEATEAGLERRSFRWFVEADTDSNGYDSQNEKSAFWVFVRLSLDRDVPNEPDKGEDIDLNNFGLCIVGEE